MRNYFLPPQLLPCQSNAMPCGKQPRQLILYQSHLIFVRTQVTLHHSGKRSRYSAFSLVEVSAVMFSSPTLLQFTHCIYFVLSVIFCETLHFRNCKNPNHVTEGILLLGSCLSLVNLRKLTLFILVLTPLRVRWYDPLAC